MIFNTKKRFFKDKIDQVTKTIWEMEFKVEKSRQVREGVRQDRDRSIEAVGHVKARIEASQDEAEKDNLKKELEGLEDSVSRYEKQMKMIDDQIVGSNGDKDNEPVIGILEQIKSLTELRNMYKDYIKKI